jgi:hypothetical protein
VKEATVTITKLFGAASLATMLAFNVISYAAAQDPTSPGAEPVINEASLPNVSAGQPTAKNCVIHACNAKYESMYMRETMAIPAIDKIDDTLLGPMLGLGAGLPTATTGGRTFGSSANYAVDHPISNVEEAKALGEILGDGGRQSVLAGGEISNMKPTLSMGNMDPWAARSPQFAPAIEAMPPSIKPTQGIQGQKAPAARTLR